jgi:hypothetical protein
MARDRSGMVAPDGEFPANDGRNAQLEIVAA